MKTLMPIILISILYFSFIAIKSNISPDAYNPPKAKTLSASFAQNDRLKMAKHIMLGKDKGPEDIAIDEKGRIYAGVENGKILRITYINGLPSIEEFANTGGRPLGLEFDKIGNLIVADSIKGLLSISKQNKVSSLTTSANGRPFKFTDDLDIANSGIIYFSDASSKFSQHEYLYDMVEAKPHGRLLSYNPITKKTTVELDKLYFANGVAISKDETFLLVNETYRYRIIKYWLKGKKAGTKEIFMDNLPGFPDGISSDNEGNFWLALFTVRNNLIDSIHPYPIIKKIFALLPPFLWPKPQPYGFVVKISSDGKILKSYQDPMGSEVKEITSIEKNKNNLYFGTLNINKISWLPIQ